MIDNLFRLLEDRKDMNFICYSVYYNFLSLVNLFIGRVVYIVMLDFEFFIEKLFLVFVLDYFR